jgi:hypothetical protein
VNGKNQNNNPPTTGRRNNRVNPKFIVEKLDKDLFGEDKLQEKNNWDDSITCRTPIDNV